MTGQAPATPLPIVVLISGGGTNLQAILDRAAAGSLPVEVRAVISNRADAAGLERARAAGVPTEVVRHRDYPDRGAFDAELARRIDAREPALVVLTGFMRILTDDFVTRYTGRMLNVHPSLLPRHKGLDTHRRALEAGDREHGSSVHFVTPGVDDGPVVIQARVPVRADDTPEALEARVRPWEYIILPQAIHLFAEGRLRLEGETVLLDGAPLEAPLAPESTPEGVTG
ncbi:MAG: phosphoribosylglycinamide formyltransferase [Thiohalospira sp.]